MQGFNMGRYVPPELEGVLNHNQASGKGHALGDRARKSNQGILTVRFEMPFAIWCSSCPKPTIIGQGVRFNAEKKKIGNYYSSPIYSFRMRHVACQGVIEIQTDPKTTSYVVVEGATKRDHGEDRLREGEHVIANARTEEEKLRLEGDPFAALEVKIGDQKVAQQEKMRLQELYQATERDWDDPGSANRRLRKSFRIERKAREAKLAGIDAIKDRYGLAIDLLDQEDHDSQRAKLIDFHPLSDSSMPSYKPLFVNSNCQSQPQRTFGTKSVRTKGRNLDKDKSARLGRQLDINTRAIVDPFNLSNASASVNSGKSCKNSSRLLVSNPHATRLAKPSSRNEVVQSTASIKSSAPLVDYDSD